MAMCQHDKVVRREDGTHHCDYCEAEFFHLDFQPGKITFTPMPEMATLRDQFAMAALNGMTAKFKGECVSCTRDIDEGERILFDFEEREAYCSKCGERYKPDPKGKNNE